MTLALLREKIFPAAFNKPGSKFVKCELDTGAVGQDQFQSNVVFVTVIVQNSDNVITSIPLVVKFEPFNVELRSYLNTPVQFYNEVLMYCEILPLLAKCNKDIVDDTFPKFYYGLSNVEDPDNDVLMIEDLRPLGYKLAEEKGFLDYEHIALAMAGLGKFHALSYAAKQEFSNEFYKLEQDLKESAWTDKNTWLSMVIACFHRAIDPLIKQDKHVEVLQKLLNCIEADFLKFMKTLTTPEETHAVICHGDFCRNNMLFRYDDGLPVDVKFFDIATARYSSPAVDIAFFLFLNSSKEVRNAHWDDLLSIYHESLSTTIPRLVVPSLEDVKEEVRQKALYGFVHCSFFLPMMFYEKPFDTLDEVMKNPLEGTDPIQVRIGGEEGTRLLSDMVEELIDRGCLTLDHKFLA